MLDDDLLGYMNECIPPMNDALVQGLAYTEQKKIIQYIDGLLQIFSKSIKDLTGMTYTGLSPITPFERLRHETRQRNSKHRFEINRSDFYVVKATFRHHGVKMRDRYIHIPYLRRGSTFRIRDVWHMVIPTLADEFFSIEDGSVFVPVTRARFVIHRQPYSFIADGHFVNVDYYWGKLHRNKKNEAPKSRHPQINNYLFAERGVTGAFKHYYDADVVFGTEEEIGDTDYPEEDWVICQSAGTRPRGRIEASHETVANVRIAVRRADFDKHEVKSALASIFYITDMSSGLAFFDVRDFDDTYLWERILSRFIWKDIDERVAMEHVHEHIESISEYIDDFVKPKLARLGITGTTINDLFAHVLSNFPAMVTQNNVAATLNKRLSVVEEILFPIQSMIFNLMFVLQRKQPKDFKNTGNLENILHREWKGQTLLYLGNSCDAVQVFESATDQNIFRAGSQMHVPSKTSSKSKSSEMQNPAFALHPDMIFTNSWMAITKASPTARNRFNVFAQLDNHNRFIVPEKYIPWHQQLTELL